MQSLGLKSLAPKVAARPVLIASIAALITLLAGFLMMTQTKFTGDITENLSNDSQTYLDFQALEAQFHPFSEDENLLIRAKNLADPQTHQKVQDFLLELQFASQVETAFSIFSLPDITTNDTASGSEPQFYLTSPDQRDKPIDERLKGLLKSIPLANKMLTEDLTASIVVLILTPSPAGQPKGFTTPNHQEIIDLASTYADDFTISFVGIPEIQRTIRTTLNKDQTKLTIASTLLSLLVAWGIFRSWRGALICSLPPIIGLVWYFGFLAVFAIPVDFLTTIVPTMVIVVAFADGVHLYMSIQRKRADGEDTQSSIAHAITTTGPACFLASLTTSLAFVGIGLGGAATMHRLSVTGAVGIMLAFLSVLFVLPTLAHFLLDRKKNAKVRTPSLLLAPGRPAIWLATRHRRSILLFSILLSVVLIAIHIALPASFRVTDYLSEDVKIRQDEVYLEEKLGGGGQLFAILPDPDGQKGITPSDAEAFRAILTSLNKQLPQPLDADPLINLMQQFEENAQSADNAVLRRFVSKDGLSYLVPIPVGTMLSAEKISEYADSLTAQLAQDGLANSAKLSGLSLLTARETPNLIRDLQSGLITAILIVIGAIILIVGSLRVGLACLLPNLIPILAVEAVFWIIDRPLSMTAVIALTIAFGIAVDNSIHLLNQYRLAGRTHADSSPADTMATAIRAVTPAVLATTMLLVAGLSMTQLSALPSVILFGQLVITALLVALLADLCILPSFLIALEKKTNKQSENPITRRGMG